MEKDAARIHDLEALRALSNPDRMRVLALLRNQGEQTVGGICEAIGIAPGSASYHLRQLAKAGLAEKVEGNGADKRQSWWKATSTSTLIDAGPEDDACLDAQINLRQAAARSYAGAYSRYLGSYGEIEEEWLTCEIGFDVVMCMTPEETKALGDELSAVIDRWRDACADRSEACGRKILVTVQGYPWIP
jgi:DNA-binding transcriptional ArsR family regulator